MGRLNGLDARLKASAWSLRRVVSLALQGGKLDHLDVLHVCVYDYNFTTGYHA
jgi:hypothetical protein